MSDHADTALDQLRSADDIAVTPEQQHTAFLAAAQVHALLDVAAAVRESGMQIAVGQDAPFNAAVKHLNELRLSR